jgi:hypothetical protein
MSKFVWIIALEFKRREVPVDHKWWKFEWQSLEDKDVLEPTPPSLLNLDCITGIYKNKIHDIVVLVLNNRNGVFISNETYDKLEPLLGFITDLTK